MFGLISPPSEFLPNAEQSIWSCVLYDTKVILMLLSNHVISERNEERKLLDQLLVHACRSINEEYIPTPLEALSALLSIHYLYGD